MADLSQALKGTFDASNVEPATARELLPPGKYVAQIIESEMKDTQSGGKMLALTLEIQDGPHTRRRLWDNLNLVNSNPKAVEIAQRTLSAICHAIGRMQVNDSDELHFRPMLLSIEVEPDSRDKHLNPSDPNRRYQNKVKGYAKADGSAAPAPRPMAAPPAQAQASAPQARPAAAPASNQPPWRRSA